MTKAIFLEQLSYELKRNNISDASEIIEEYTQHFTFKLADGYSEEEIAAKLGDPKVIAKQFDSASCEKRGGRVMIATIGLSVTDFFFGILLILLYAWAVVMIAAEFAFAVTAVALIGNLGRFPHFSVPEMPYPCAVILGLAFIALAVLFAVGTFWYFRFVLQLIRSFGRFHKNTLAAASGKATFPTLPVYPQLSVKTKRTLRKIAIIAVILFAACFIAGFAACVIAAGSFEFWHSWGWFGYPG